MPHCTLFQASSHRYFVPYVTTYSRTGPYDSEFQSVTAKALHTERLQKWVAWADRHLEGGPQKLILNTGNDDPPYCDEILKTSKVIVPAEGQVIKIDGERSE